MITAGTCESRGETKSLAQPFSERLRTAVRTGREGENLRARPWTRPPVAAATATARGGRSGESPAPCPPRPASERAFPDSRSRSFLPVGKVFPCAPRTSRPRCARRRRAWKHACTSPTHRARNARTVPPLAGDEPPLRRLQGTLTNRRRCSFSPVPRGQHPRVTIPCSATLPHEAMESFGTARDQRDCRVPPARPRGASPSASGTFRGSLAASRCREGRGVLWKPAELSGSRFPEFRTPGLPGGRLSGTDCWKARTSGWWLRDGEGTTVPCPVPRAPSPGTSPERSHACGAELCNATVRSAHLRTGKERASPLGMNDASVAQDFMKRKLVTRGRRSQHRGQAPGRALPVSQTPLVRYLPARRGSP